ncbi:MAG: hypothetical protein NT022_12555, partial [Deltaproteobacteria bacterium]|nr:hypothetical protein [Deltaproteobacteria bacterium]
MRKFWIVLLTMGLIVAFAMPAAALDVKFGGSYYVQGIYDHNRSLKDNAGATGDGSTAFIAQRLRIQTEFKVAEGLSLVTRFDALEKKWGDTTWAAAPTATTNYDSVNRGSAGNAGSRVQENIEFERAYIDFNTAIGKFMVGYQNFIAFGTSFLDTHVARPGIKYILPIGNSTIVLAMEQIREGTSTPTVSPSNQGLVTEGDKTAYDVAFIQKWQGGDAGVLVQYLVGSDTSAASHYKTKAYIIDPYVKATFGPVFVEAELYYGGGKLQDPDRAGVADVDIKTWGAYVHALANFAPAYVGAKFMYMRGNDPSSTDTREGSLAALLSMGQIASPCLILWNDETSTWMNGLTGYGANSVNNFPDNLWLYGLYGGVKPMPKLDVQLGVYYAYADQRPANHLNKDFGTEIDLIAKYKIY